MRIINTTNISNELVQAIALDVSLDLRECILIIEYRNASKGIPDNYGGKFTHRGSALVVQVNPWSKTSTLAHELRHAAQSQALGKQAFIEVYSIETDIEGYESNVLEVDAREAGGRWKV